MGIPHAPIDGGSHASSRTAARYAGQKKFSYGLLRKHWKTPSRPGIILQQASPEHLTPGGGDAFNPQRRSVS